MPPRKVILGGDPHRLATNGSWEQRFNVEMLQVIAAGLFTGVDIEVASPASLGIAPVPGVDTVSQWARLRQEPLTPEVEAAYEALLQDAFYLGFETPDDIWHLVGKRGGRALDLRLHPCRFGPDYYFLARGHDVPLDALVDQRTVEQEIEIAAATLRFDASRAGSPRIKGQDGVIALQMPEDSALLDDGGFANLADHEQELVRFAEAHPIVWIKTHPHSPPGEADRLAVLRLENGRLTERGTYQLLASGQARGLLALSSSILHEASLLGADVVPLRPDLSHGFPVREEFVAAGLQDLFGPVASWLSGTDPLAASAPRSRPLKALLNIQWGRTDAQPPPPPPPVIPERLMPLSARPLADSMTYGWYEADPWGVWCGGLSALDFSWPQTAEDYVRLEMTAAVYTGGRGVTDEVEIWSGGRRLVTAILPNNHGDPGVVRFDVPRPKSGDNVQIVFYRRFPRRPCDMEGVPDFRSLGFMLYAIGQARPETD